MPQLQIIITLLLLYKIYNHSTLIFSVYFHWSSLSVSWQRIYNTGTIKVSITHSQCRCTTAYIKCSNHMLNLHRLTSCVLLRLTACLLYSSSLPLYSGRLLLSLEILLTYIDAAQTRTYREHITWSLSSLSIGALASPTENTCHVISKHCCVTSLRMRKLHRHKENTVAV
jgi:hypothetical protein